MPRSKDPRSYGPFYDKLAELMDKGEPDIKLKMTRNEAIYHRNNFYAFINAWKHEAERIAKSRLITAERKPHLTELAIRMEDVLRRYICLIEGDQDEVTLRFIERGLDERQQSGIAQLDKLLAQNTNPSYHEMLERIKHPAPASHGSATQQGAGVVTKFLEMTGSQQFQLESLDTSETTEEDIAKLTNDPPVHDDLSDLITQSNSPDSPTQQEYQKLMTQHLLPDDSSEKNS